MKRGLSVVLVVALLMGLVSCASDKGGTEDLQAKVKELEDQIEEMRTTVAKARKEYDDMKAQKEATEKELKEYVEKMKPYEGLSDAEIAAKTAEAEAKKVEAEKALKEKEATEAAEKEEKARIAAEEEAKGYESGITYQDIARFPDDNKGKKVKFTGKVVQLMEDTKENQLRVAVDGDYDQIIYVLYKPSIVSQRVLEEDTITLYGVSMGTITYQSTFGGNITIPAVSVDRIDFE